MPLGRRISKDVAARMEADRRLADSYRERLADASAAEAALRTAQGEGAPAHEVKALEIAFDQALTVALEAAQAAERVAMGPKVYVPEGQDGAARRAAEIAERKARARWSVRPWTDEVERLRTARETHRLSFRAGRGVAVA
ncbi:plectin [Actinomadura logoneensis]|uniref:Plectin n=2 Tax=Actinomadura logoneensis TaxID=2293572 RepID=A0A372JHH6_9ACTN|nr:plectin [Actinomadura logoneensis]